MVQIAVPCTLDPNNKDGDQFATWNGGYITKSTNWGGSPDIGDNPDIKARAAFAPFPSLKVAQWTGGRYDTGFVIPNTAYPKVSLYDGGNQYTAQFTIGPTGSGPFQATPWPIMVGNITVSFDVFSAFGEVQVNGIMECFDATFTRLIVGGNTRTFASMTQTIVPINTLTRLTYTIDRNVLLTRDGGQLAATKFVTLNNRMRIVNSVLGKFNDGRYIYDGIWYGNFDVQGSAALRTIYPGVGGTKTSSLYRYKNTTNPTDVG